MTSDFETFYNDLNNNKLASLFQNYTKKINSAFFKKKELFWF